MAEGLTAMLYTPGPEPQQEAAGASGKQASLASFVIPDRPVRLPDAVVTRDTPVGRAAKRCLEHFDQRVYASGITLELCNDFELLADINPYLEKLPLTPQFDPKVSDISPVNGFWIKGVDARGEVVYTHAVRYDDIGNTPLASHFSSLRAFYADPEVTADADERCVVEAPAAYTIAGKLCYQGELWIKKSSGFRGHDLAYTALRVTHAITLARWNPDYIYATINPGIAAKGVLARYGYTHAQPNGIRWNIPRTGELLDEWLIWIPRRDLIDIVNSPFVDA